MLEGKNEFKANSYTYEYISKTILTQTWSSANISGHEQKNEKKKEVSHEKKKKKIGRIGETGNKTGKETRDLGLIRHLFAIGLSTSFTEQFCGRFALWK